MLLEVSTTVGCRIACPYCPQKQIVQAYHGERYLRPETLRRALDNCPPNTPVNFAGFAEPFFNPQCTELIEMACAGGRHVQLFTTGAGLTDESVERIIRAGLQRIFLHLPDAEGNMRMDVTADYVRRMMRLASEIPTTAYWRGSLHPSLAAIPAKELPIQNRAGNLSDMKPVLLGGNIRCRASLLDHPNMLPDGRLVVCCQDWSMQHVLGNLAEKRWDEIVLDDPMLALQRAMASGADCLCRHCGYADSIGPAIERRATLLSYATQEYVEAQRHLHKSGAAYFDRHLPCGPADLTDEFRAKHAGHLRYKRGAGWWVWKPWMIRNALDTLAPGEFLMYCDSQIEFLTDPAPLFDLCKKSGGISLFHQAREGHKNRTWTHRDCFALMGCDEPKYWDGWQLNNAVSVWQNTPLARSVADEWYTAMSDLRVVWDGPTERENLPNFRAHRHDQSVLSLIAIRRGLPTYADPSRFGEGYPGRDYPTIVRTVRNVAPPYRIPCLSPG